MRYNWIVEWNYGDGWDEVYCGMDRADALARPKEYRDNCPGVPHRLRRVRGGAS